MVTLQIYFISGNLDTSSSTTNTSQSILLAGNIMYDQDGKKLDLSLLDEDDDDDDIQEFTIDDIIQDLDLLDETDDEVIQINYTQFEKSIQLFSTFV